MAKRKVVNPLSCHGSSPDASLMRPEEGCCMSFGHVVEAFKSACKPGVLPCRLCSNFAKQNWINRIDSYGSCLSSHFTEMFGFYVAAGEKVGARR